MSRTGLNLNSKIKLLFLVFHHPAVRQSSTATTDTEQGRVRTKLRKFLQRRPTLQSVKDKGYIKGECVLNYFTHVIFIKLTEN